jgi:hypothetical protein
MHLRLISGLVVLATLVASLSHPVGNHSHRQCGGYGGFRRQCCGKDRWFVEGVMLVIAEEEQRYGALVTTDFTKADAFAFANEHQLLATEDRGDTLHTQLNTLDSVWAFEVKAKNKSPIRFIALGRDATSIAHGEDNEPTGLFVSNGSADPKHLLGTAESLARGFFTQQHWDNNLYEILPITGPVAMRN